jgi:S-adenosylmethionine decarboxylase
MEDPIGQAYQKGDYWGLAASIDLHSCHPDTIRDAEKIKQFVAELCAIIKMKPYGECTVVHFGEDRA